MTRAALTVGGVVVAFAAVGVLNLTGTAAPSVAVLEAQARLDALPAEIAGWRGVPREVPADQLRVAEALAHVSRDYRRGLAGPWVNVLVLFGEPGPLGAHSPEVCYPSAGYNPVGPAGRRPVSAGAADSLWSAKFESGGPVPAGLRVDWAWSAGGAWEAADEPRLRFAGHDRIYKLYVCRAAADRDPAGEFLGPLLDALRTTLFGPPPAALVTAPSAAAGTSPATAGRASPRGERP